MNEVNTEGKKEKNEGTRQAKLWCCYTEITGKKKRKKMGEGGGGDERGLDSAHLTWDSLLH